MKNLFFVIFLLTLFCSSKKIETFPVTNTQTFHLKGNVKIMIQKTQSIHVDSLLNYTIDTNRFNGLTKYFYFSPLLELDSSYVLKEDTLFLSKDIFYKSPNSNNIYSSQYTKDGNQTLETVVISYKNNIVTKRVNSKSQVKFKSKIIEKWVNSKIQWMQWTLPFTKGYYKWTFERDSNGFERKIYIEMGPNSNKLKYTVLIQYLEWDSLGNWTKRIEYNESDWTGSLVSRKIVYSN